MYRFKSLLTPIRGNHFFFLTQTALNVWELLKAFEKKSTKASHKNKRVWIPWCCMTEGIHSPLNKAWLTYKKANSLPLCAMPPLRDVMKSCFTWQTKSNYWYFICSTLSTESNLTLWVRGTAQKRAPACTSTRTHCANLKPHLLLLCIRLHLGYFIPSVSKAGNKQAISCCVWDDLNEEDVGSCELSHIMRTRRRLEFHPDRLVTLAKR